MRLLLLLALLARPYASAAADRPVSAPDSPRVTYNFNSGWKLLVGDPAGAERPDFDDSAWTPVTLPHAWNEDAAFKVAIAQRPAMRVAVNAFELFFNSLFLFAWLRCCRSGMVRLRLRG
jgi:hypothetical protein